MFHTLSYLVLIVNGSILDEQGPNALSGHGQIGIVKLETALAGREAKYQMRHGDILYPNRLSYMMKILNIDRQKFLGKQTLFWVKG